MRIANDKKPMVTDEIIEKRSGLKLTGFKVKVEEDSSHFTIVYFPKDTIIRGCGGVFKVLKRGCEVTKLKLYQ